MVWTDLDRWHWEGLSLSPGLHMATFETSIPITEPVSARITFGPGGAIGKLALGPFQDPADALLALPSRRNVAIRMEGPNFVAGSAEVLAPGQYLSSNLVGAEQTQRREVYAQLLERRIWPRYPMRPTFLVWTKPLDVGFAFPSDSLRTGAALVAIPVEFDRPPAGTTVTIPAPFLAYQSMPGKDLALFTMRNRTNG